MLTSVIDTKVDSDVASIDIPNLFIQKPIYRKPGEEKITMKIKEVLVDILAHMYPEKFGPNLVYGKKKESVVSWGI